MGYVITNHNEGDFILAGPMEWKPRYFSSVISDEVDEIIVVDREDEQRVPFDPYPGITIRRCFLEFEDNLNPNIEEYGSPEWIYLEIPEVREGKEYHAKAFYAKKPKNVELVKEFYKKKLADERWKKESLGVKLVIQGKEVSCDTSRGNRDIFLQKYLMMSDTDIVKWKFPEGWLNLSKQELGYIVFMGSNYIQQQFDNESILNDTLSSLTTLEEVNQFISQNFPSNTEETLDGKN